ncbi:hypothetical protein WDU94_010787 [Cyamophila willieti]
MPQATTVTEAGKRCKAKWDNLMRAFRNHQKHVRTTGAGTRKTPQYYEEMDYYCSILIWRRKYAIRADLGEDPTLLSATAERMTGFMNVPTPIHAYLSGMGEFTDKRGIRWKPFYPELGHDGIQNMVGLDLAIL